jgi:predicted aldo/keto reductase-like oxidoreductase
MLYRTVPQTGDKLSILGFGCMRLPQSDGHIDEPRAARQIRHAIDQGVNYIDTAWPYHAGESEPFLGRALAGGYRERVYLATKLPIWLVKTRADMDRFLEAQLRKLATGHIDYYLVHGLTGESWQRLKALGIEEFLDRAQDAGKIVRIGFSSHTLKDDFKSIVDVYPWSFCQIQYNYLDQEQQAGTEGMKYAASKGLAVIIMEPLRGGTLAAPPPSITALWQEAPQTRTPAEWALRWLWNQPEVTVVLSGMNTEAQVEENLKVAADAHADSLMPAELDLVNRVSREFRGIMKVGCTGCGYCQPCPSGVDIPGCLDAFNAWHTFGDQGAPFVYVLRGSDVLSGKRAYASLCNDCRDCVAKCPQGLEIPDVLKECVTLFETGGVAEREAMLRKMFS